MPIWFKAYSLSEVRSNGSKTLLEHLAIEFTELGEDYLVARMPVDSRTRQPFGILHGGASVALAESLSSSAGNMVVDSAKEYCVGLEINANHISSARDGFVEGKTKPVHLGRTTQVWETRIHQGERLVCISRMTLAVLTRK